MTPHANKDISLDGKCGNMLKLTRFFFLQKTISSLLVNLSAMLIEHWYKSGFYKHSKFKVVLMQLNVTFLE